MTNLFSKWSRHSSRIVCLLTFCGLMHACKDEFILDDEKPSWLSESVYSSLEQKGNYRTYLRLLADKDVNSEGARPLSDILKQTGSKTVFVADDDAWNAFFAANALLPESNPWHYATSYEALSPAQKKLLIHTSMLNNAIVMENLASSESSGNNSPTRGEYMRRYTDVNVLDSITYMPSQDLPFSYSPNEKDYWAKFREENGGRGIYLVTDSTPSMMLHFTSEHMTRNVITDEDFSYFMGRPRNTSDVHIYNALLLDKDGVCENGYVNMTERPLYPLTNMAEAIRTNGKTKIFSHILDRFSAPYYCEMIDKAYKNLHPDFPETDSIYTKRYFSANNFSTKGGYTTSLFEPGDKAGTYEEYDPYLFDPDKIPSLKFDPGWNGYYDEVDVRKDMAAMFVPSDEAMWDYFRGPGAELISVHYAHEGTEKQIPFVPATTEDELFRQIDCIPVGVLDGLVKNLMHRSFVQSVPSKWAKLTDDAMEELFADVDEAKRLIDTCLLCNNGVVYVMGLTPVPADYRSVAAPAYINSTTNGIMKEAIYAGYDPKKTDFMNLNYYAYLKAMRSKFTLFMPSDSALAYYYDPASMKSRTPRVTVFEHQSGTPPVKLTFYNYNCPYNSTREQVGTIGSRILGSNQYDNTEVSNRLKDILESHTIVHDETNPMTRWLQEYFGIPSSEPLNEYFLSKNGNAVKVVRNENDEVIEVKGGFQLENERLGIESETPGVTSCKISKWYYGLDNGNGDTYILRAPLVPTYRSVYSIFTNDLDQHKFEEDGFGGETPYSEFYNLCKSGGFDNEIIGCGLVDENLTNKQQESALKKFKIFIEDNGLDYNVQFFNNYRYLCSFQ